jgi:hypothetical protein
MVADKMRRRILATLWAMLLVGAAVPPGAVATPVSAVLTGGNGEGTFDPTLPCGQGDGPSWRYAWLDGPASGAALGGTWNGTFEVHDAGGGRAFVPTGDGRLAIANGRGTGFFETLGDGGCGNAPLDLTTQPDGDPHVSGTLPVVARGGTGALRGLTGSGTATVALELGSGADNLATVELAADLDLPDAQLTVAGASSRWPNLTSYLARRLAVSVTLANAQGAGDAFDVQLTGVTGGTGSFSGLPTAKATIPAGGRATFTFTMNGAAANRSYTIGLGAAAQDGLSGAHPPTNGSATFRSPLLP